MSFLNWAGGKAKVLPHIVSYVPKEIHNYYEPFLGGGSVLLYVLDEVEKGNIQVEGKFVCADINWALIQCYNAIKKHPEEVIRAYENLGSAFDKCPEKSECKKRSSICLCKECFYHAARTCFNVYCRAGVDLPIEIASHFLFLNATCYRGLYRESKSGIMNSCFWTTRTIVLKSQEIREAARLFRKYRVTFVHADFRTFLEQHCESLEDSCCKSFIFLDPPYIPLKHTSLISNEYHRDGFNDDDTKTLVKWMCEHRDEYWISMCNHYTEPLIDLCNKNDANYTWPICKQYDVRRSMKYCGESSVANEVIVSNVTEDSPLALASQ